MDYAETGLVLPTQEGGRLLGQGVYGCIFSPPLQCQQRGKSSKKKGRLGKLTEVIDIKNEIRAAELFVPVKKEAAKYMILPMIETLCKPAPISSQKEKDIAKCEILQKRGGEKMLQYELEYGGKALGERLRQIDIVKALPFWEFTGKLLEIGAFMAFHGFIHNDLHSNNILVNAAFHPRLIDFGRSYLASEIQGTTVEELEAGSFMPELGQISPESSMQDGIVLGQPIPKLYAEIRSQKPAISMVEKVLGISRDAQMAEFKHFCETSRAFQAKDWVTVWKLYWPTVDSWAIGHCIMRILSRLIVSKEFTGSSEWKERGGILKSIVKGLLRTSPHERLDCVEALAMYDPTNDLLDTPTGKRWLEVKQSRRARGRRV